LLYGPYAFNKVGKIDPACRPPRSQRIPHKPGKVVVQMVVYLPSPLAQKPVLATFLKGGSEDTLSVLEHFWSCPSRSWDGSVCLLTP